MAGCSADRSAWWGSARGGRVDFTGPAQDVWKATYVNGVPDVKPGSGTSFATAMTAGLAALWLGHHGRASLITKYDPDVKLTEVFRWVLKRSASRPPSSWFGGFGPIVNARRALETPLPDAAVVRASLLQESTAGETVPDVSCVSEVCEFMGGDVPTGTAAIAEMLDVPEASIAGLDDRYADELLFHAMSSLGGESQLTESTGTSRIDRATLSTELQEAVERAP